MKKRRVILLAVAVTVGFGVAVLAVVSAARRSHAQSQSCASSITSICLAARFWAEDHEGFMPTNFICMSNELVTPKVLSCIPARRTRTHDWAALSLQNCTYEILAPGMRADDTNTAYLRCTIHGHLGYSDGTVFDGVRRRHKFD